MGGWKLVVHRCQGLLHSCLYANMIHEPKETQKERGEKKEDGRKKRGATIKKYKV